MQDIEDDDDYDDDDEVEKVEEAERKRMSESNFSIKIGLDFIHFKVCAPSVSLKMQISQSVVTYVRSLGILFFKDKRTSRR